MQVYSNYAKSQIATDITDLDTTIVLQAASGSLFQVPGATEFELLIITDGTDWEVVKVTDRVSDNLTVERGYEGTARSWLTGSVIKSTITEETMNQFLQRDEVGASFALFAYQNFR